MVGLALNNSSELPVPSVNNLRGEIYFYFRDRSGYYRPHKMIAQQSLKIFDAIDSKGKYGKFSIDQLKPLILS